MREGETARDAWRNLFARAGLRDARIFAGYMRWRRGAPQQQFNVDFIINFY